MFKWMIGNDIASLNILGISSIVLGVTMSHSASADTEAFSVGSGASLSASIEATIPGPIGGSGKVSTSLTWGGSVTTKLDSPNGTVWVDGVSSQNNSSGSAAKRARWGTILKININSSSVGISSEGASATGGWTVVKVVFSGTKTQEFKIERSAEVFTKDVSNLTLDEIKRIAEEKTQSKEFGEKVQSIAKGNMAEAFATAEAQASKCYSSTIQRACDYVAARIWYFSVTSGGGGPYGVGGSIGGSGGSSGSSGGSSRR
jgi:hypothetical protein